MPIRLTAQLLCGKKFKDTIMHIEFAGKTAIVTGAAHGFGRAIAIGFAQRGASVWACDVIESELAETKKLASANG